MTCHLWVVRSSREVAHDKEMREVGGSVVDGCVEICGGEIEARRSAVGETVGDRHP